MRNKSYGYTLYTHNGQKIRGNVSASSEDIAERTVQTLQENREDVQFYTIDTLDSPCDYDWDDKLKMWQSTLQY